MTTQQPTGHATIDFAAILLDLESGRVNARLGSTLHELVEAVQNTGRKGTVTLKLTVAKSRESGQVEITADVDSKKPKHESALNLFFASDDNTLSRHDPAQLAIGTWEEH